MAIDIGTIPKTVVAAMTVGLRTEQASILDSTCERHTRETTLEGFLPRKTSKSTLARIDNVDLPPLARAKAHRGAMTKTAFHCTASVGFGEVSDEEQNDLGVYGDDALAGAVNQAVTDSNFGVDYRGTLLLESTVLNNQYDAVADGTGKWTDKVLGQPLADMLLGMETLAAGADTIYFGPVARRILLAHPSIIAQTHFFSAGQLNASGLQALLSEQLEIEIANIHYINKKYDGANPNQAALTTFLANNLFWIGHKRDFIMIDPAGAPMNNSTEVSRVANGRLHEVQHTRYVDFVRPTKELGVTFTTII